MMIGQHIKRCVSVMLVAVILAAMCVPYVNAADVNGDIDGDGRLSMKDTMLLYRYTSGKVMLPAAQVAAADINGNGVVDMLDTMRLFMYVSYGVPEEPTPTEPLRGMDVSYAQGTIDWQTVVNSGEIDFAILRCGYGQDMQSQDDTMWETNAAACEAYGMPYGAYFFCYARNVEEAYGEARHALRLLEGKNMTYPIFYDMEYSSWQGDLTNSEYAAIAEAFCETLRENGYTVGVYANLNWWNTRLTAPCFDNWYRWVAQYNDTCDYEGEYHLWQYTQDGEVDGIDTNTVDLNLSYVTFSGN